MARPELNRGRRRFLIGGATLGGGLLLGWGLFKPRDLLGPADLLPTGVDEIALNAWVKIGADGIVTVAVPRAEMGQGVMTALPMLVAEELDVPWSSVRAEAAPIDRIYGNILMLPETLPFGPDDDGWLAESARWTVARISRVLGIQATGGSTSVGDAWLPMRAAGAAARDMLVRAAAARLDVAPADCRAEQGRVIHDASGRALDYGAVAGDAAALAPPGRIPFKDPSTYRLIGRPAPRLDIPSKVDGSARFGIDARPDNLAYAAFARCPVVGGQVGRFDRDALLTAPGVRAVTTTDDTVIVIADGWWQARQALVAHPPEFDPGPNGNASTTTIFASLRTGLDTDDGAVYERYGDVDGTLEAAESSIVSAEYEAPLLAHATLEPMNCTARIADGRCELWLGSQVPSLVRDQVAKLTGFDRDQVEVHQHLLGGGFGRRGDTDYALLAVHAALALPGRPVQTVWSREDDTRHDNYRPPAVSRFRALLGSDGRSIAAWDNRVATPSLMAQVMPRSLGFPAAGPDKTGTEGAIFLPYRMDHRRVTHAAVPVPLNIGFWRSVGHSNNAFFTECFMDELAGAADCDPIEFRLVNLDATSRHSKVLKLAAARSGWGTDLPPGHARGVALHESFRAIVAEVAEVSREASGWRVHRVTCAADCGRVINPDTVIAQMESAIVFGLTAALYGEITIADGRVEQSNFPDYRMLTLAETPAIDVHVVASGDEPGGVGEPGTPPIFAAVANAASVLAGRRIRSLPLSRHL